MLFFSSEINFRYFLPKATAPEATIIIFNFFFIKKMTSSIKCESQIELNLSLFIKSEEPILITIFSALLTIENFFY